MEPLVLMSVLLTHVASRGLEAARQLLEADAAWPDIASGLAYVILSNAGAERPAFSDKPLRVSTALQMRRTPELAAFGYVADTLDSDATKLWAEGVNHLRGRQIYPSDRNSFIFNPVEILGVARGLSCVRAELDAHREWFIKTICKGLEEGQFRSAITQIAAFTALKCLGHSHDSASEHAPLDLSTVSSAELVLLAGIDLAFGIGKPSRRELEDALLQLILGESLILNDVAEAATVLVILQRTIDRVSLGSEAVSPTDRIIALCRRFPLLVQRLQQRQRGRLPFTVKDEYDVQDLLHGILKLHFDDVRPEEYTPSHAGAASRVDFLLPLERIVVEAKMTRPSLKHKEVVDELIIDATRYSKLGSVDTLICLIYDPGRYFVNPKAAETDVEAASTRLTVHAVVCPHGL
jgi:hypothetical protein